MYPSITLANFLQPFLKLWYFIKGWRKYLFSNLCWSRWKICLFFAWNFFPPFGSWWEILMLYGKPVYSLFDFWSYSLFDSWRGGIKDMILPCLFLLAFCKWKVIKERVKCKFEDCQKCSWPAGPAVTCFVKHRTAIWYCLLVCVSQPSLVTP